MKPIKLYWWQGDGAHDQKSRNFGDYLSPLMVAMASGRSVEYAPVAEADMLAIGTILSKERKARGLFSRHRLHIWGSGAGAVDETFSNSHYYHAVRGTETRSRIKGKAGDNAVLGDPGLLVANYWEGRRRTPKRYALGVIPHFVDFGDPIVSALLQIKGSILINVFDPIDEVLESVMACHHVVSSSLHGLIVSDALDVPNRRIIISDNIKSNLKFSDYYSAFGLEEPTPIRGTIIDGNELPEKLVSDYKKRDVERVCTDLLRAFPQI